MRPMLGMWKHLRGEWYSLSIRSKMIFIMVLGLVSISALFAYLGISATIGTTEHALQERVLVAQLIASHFDGYIEHIQTMMQDVAEQLSDELWLRDAQRDDLHKVLMGLSSVARYVAVIDRQGSLVDERFFGPTIPGLSVRGHPSVSETLQTGQFRVSGLVRPSDGAEGIVLFSVAIRDEQETVIGALVAAVDTSEEDLSGFLRPIAAIGTGYSDVVDQQGIVLFSSRTGRRFLQTEHRGILFDMIQRSVPIAGRCHDCHQAGQRVNLIPQVIAFAPLGRADWGVLVRQSEEEAFAEVRNLRHRLVIATVIAVGICLVLVSLTARSVVQPLEQAAGIAESIAEGNLEREIEINRADEVGRLLRTLDIMRARLRDHMQRLHSYNEALEREVERRTAALREAQTQALLSRDYLQSVIDGLEDRLVVVDQSFRVRLANAAAKNRIREGLISSEHCWEINHGGIPCDFTGCQCPVMAAFETKRPSKALHVHSDGDGQVRYVSIIASPLFDELGEVREVIELIRDVTEEKRLEEQKEILLHKVIVAQEEERKRLARELHDETGQALSALVIRCGAIEQSIPPHMKALRDGLAEQRKLAAATLRNLRALIHGLRPELLDDLGLEAAIRELVRERLGCAGIRCEVRFEDVGKLSPETEVVLFRLVQEAVTNIARHAEASAARVEVHKSDANLIIVVEDNGVGFDPQHLLGIEQSFGLRGMAERAALLGGAFQIDSAPGKGTRIRVEVPIGGLRWA
ncbi:MAG: hypothetical protein Kow0047_07900 [Anaerolineae bacterium]